MWILPIFQVKDHPIPKFILIPGPKLRPNHARVEFFKPPRPRMLLAPVLSVLLTLSMEDALRRRFLTWDETGSGGSGESFVRRGGGGVLGAGEARSPVDEGCAVPNAYGPEIAGRGLGSDEGQLLLFSVDGGLCLRLVTCLSAAALSHSLSRVGTLDKASRSASMSSTFVSSSWIWLS